jgi:hypothetical protein
MHACENVRVGEVKLGSVRLAHAQSILGNNVTSVPPHNFKQPYCWYYPGTELKNLQFEIVPYDIIFIPYFIYFRPGISTYEMCACEKDRFGKVRLAHAHWRIDKGVINVQPHNFKQPSRWCYVA